MVMQAAAGTHLAGRYRLEKQLGKGGMGTVWQAHDQVLDRTVAVKFVNSQGLGRPGAEGRLQREARILGNMAHPHLAHVHDLCDTDEGTFIVMELVHGESLAALLARQPQLPPGQAAVIAAQCAQALSTAHRAGIAHRDVKPSNIMLTSDNYAKLIDFGIAGSLNPIDTTVVGVMGTIAYLAPERVTGSPATPATDLYALGVVLYEMLAGHLPFQAEESIAMLYAHATVDPLPLPATIPTTLAETCLSLLAKDPAARPESSAVAHDLLISAAAPLRPAFPSQTTPASAPGRTILGDRPPRSPGNPTNRRPHAILLPAGALLSAVVAACAAWLITTTGTSSAAAQPVQTPSTAAYPATATATSTTTTPSTLATTNTYGPPLLPTKPAVSGPVAPPPGNPNPGKGNPNPGKGNPRPGKSK